jgi:Glu-tRNA(Gln) amidotransferase subunit E-like FAD-binding protein
MKPVKVYKAEVDITDLLSLSKNYLVKATDGKSTIIIQGRRIIAARGDPPEQKKEMVIALYAVHKRFKLNTAEYFVSKVETKISNNVKEDLEKIAQSYEHVVVEAFSKRLKRIAIVFRDGNLIYCDGNYSRLLAENKAIFDVYEVLREESRVTREEVLERLKLREPTQEEIDRIIQHAFGDRIGGYYSP